MSSNCVAHVAVIGAAGWAGSRHLSGFTEAGACVTAICDPAPTAPALAERYGATLVGSPNDLDPAELDLVVVSLPTRLQPPVVRQLLEAGHRILVEKPLAPTLAQAQELAAAPGAADRVMVGFTLHHHPAVAELRDWLAARSVISVTACSMSQKDRLDGWRCEPAEGGVVSVNGVHLLELVPSLLETRAEVVAAVSRTPFFSAGVPDHVLVTMRLGDGAPFLLETAWVPWSDPSGLNAGNWDVGVDIVTSTGRARLRNHTLELWEPGLAKRTLTWPSLDLFARQAVRAVAFAAGQRPAVGVADAVRATELVEAVNRLS